MPHARIVVHVRALVKWRGEKIVENFCTRFLSLRTSAKMSLARVASTVNIAPRTLKYYSSGEREPSLSTLVAIADLFDVSLDYLEGRTDNPKVNV